MDLLATNGHWLAVAFAFLMGLSMLLYVILDGYDLGVGILMIGADDHEKDQMLHSIGPFWDANETWLVLGVGILLVAFPHAHGAILTALYLPTTIMLLALVARGVSYDFRSKVPPEKKAKWNNLMILGSLIASMAQGYMLGSYILGFEQSWSAFLFCMLTSVFTAIAYALIGATWLIMKTEGALQNKATSWAKSFLWITAIGIGLVSIVTPLVSERIFEKWFSIPNFFLLLPIPLITGILILALSYFLSQMPLRGDRFCWAPFVSVTLIFVLCFNGLATSFYPYIIPEKMTIYGAASAPESLMIIFIGACFVLPFIIGYTFFVHKVFWGKARSLNYD